MDINRHLLGVQHIGVPTADMEATERFYTSLGFEKTFETLLGDIRVCFFAMGSVVFETYESAAAAGSAGAIDHVSLNVDDVEAVYAQLAGSFKVVSNGIEQLPFFDRGVRFFTIEGPNKEKLEFNQYL